MMSLFCTLVILLMLQENSLGYDWFCYTYIEEKASWNDAESSCAAKGGNLAAVADR